MGLFDSIAVIESCANGFLFRFFDFDIVRWAALVPVWRPADLLVNPPGPLQSARIRFGSVY